MTLWTRSASLFPCRSVTPTMRRFRKPDGGSLPMPSSTFCKGPASRRTTHRSFLTMWRSRDSRRTSSTIFCGSSSSSLRRSPRRRCSNSSLSRSSLRRRVSWVEPSAQARGSRGAASPGSRTTQPCRAQRPRPNPSWGARPSSGALTEAPRPRSPWRLRPTATALRAARRARSRAPSRLAAGATR